MQHQMIRLTLLLAGILVAGCAQSSDALAQQGNEVSELIWECQREVLAGGQLLASKTCKEYADKHAALDLQLRHHKDEYQKSFEFRVRKLLGWERASGYPCDSNCWQAQATAGWSAARFRRLIIFSQGCDMFAFSDAYFDSASWDKIDRWQKDEPCRTETQSPDP